MRVPGGTSGTVVSTMRNAVALSGASFNGSVPRNPDVCVNRCRTVIAPVPGLLNSGTYRTTGESKSTRPRSTSSMSAGVVATTLVSEARSHNVLSRLTTTLCGLQVNRPYAFSNTMLSRVPMTSTAPG